MGGAGGCDEAAVRRRRAAVLGRAHGGPLSESRNGRIWHQARSVADTPGPARLRPYDLRHAALSLWLVPRWPTRTGADSGNPVRHASVPQLDQRDTAGPGAFTQIR